MEVQRYLELDNLCKEMEKVMTRAVKETLERYCRVNVYYYFDNDSFFCEADTDYYGVTISAGCLISANTLRDSTKDEHRVTYVNYAAVLVSRLKEAMKKVSGNEKEEKK